MIDQLMNFIWELNMIKIMIFKMISAITNTVLNTPHFGKTEDNALKIFLLMSIWQRHLQICELNSCNRNNKRNKIGKENILFVEFPL